MPVHNLAGAQNDYDYISYPNLPATNIQSPSPSVAEFPNWVILVLVAVVAVVAVYIVRRKLLDSNPSQ